MAKQLIPFNLTMRLNSDGLLNTEYTEREEFIIRLF